MNRLPHPVLPYEYDPETGRFYWTASPIPDKRTDKRLLGTEADNCIDHSGRRVVLYGGKSFGAHRLAAALLYGPSKRTVVHRNGVLTDNRASNIHYKERT